MRARRRVVVGIVAAGVVVGLAGTATAAEPAGVRQAVRVEAVFNTPDDAGNPSTVLEDRLLRLINETPAGEEIGFSIYSWTRTALAPARPRWSGSGARRRRRPPRPDRPG